MSAMNMSNTKAVEKSMVRIKILARLGKFFQYLTRMYLYISGVWKNQTNMVWSNQKKLEKIPSTKSRFLQLPFKKNHN